VITRAEQIAHLSEPGIIEKFKAGQGRDVAEYFADYYEEYESENGRPGDALYMCVCADLGIEPRKGGRFDQERGTRRQKSIDKALYALGKIDASKGINDVLRAVYDRGYADAIEDAKRVQR
jgi:hypothetical protein